jgi:hypothetical protein
MCGSSKHNWWKMKPGHGKRMLVEALCQALRLEAAKAAARLPERL